jgi:hypothetical protein
MKVSRKNCWAKRFITGVAQRMRTATQRRMFDQLQKNGDKEFDVTMASEFCL